MLGRILLRCSDYMTFVACELLVLTASACMRALSHLLGAAPAVCQRLKCPAQHCTGSACPLRGPVW